jgi:hypothetical protein
MSTLSAARITDLTGKTILNNTGGILQVVQVVKTDSFYSTTSPGTYQAIPGLSASITPSSTTSKILILSTINSGNYNNTVQCFHVYRNNSQITPNGVSTGFTPNSFYSSIAGGVASNTGVSATISLCYLDSPSSISSQSYQIYGAVNSAAVYGLNVNPPGSNGGGTAGGSSSITLLEISG